MNRRQLISGSLMAAAASALPAIPVQATEPVMAIPKQRTATMHSRTLARLLMSDADIGYSEITISTKPDWCYRGFTYQGADVIVDDRIDPDMIYLDRTITLPHYAGGVMRITDLIQCPRYVGA